jgi:hypothetical protein
MARQPAAVSFVELDANPAQYRGRLVRVSGEFAPLPDPPCHPYKGPQVDWSLIDQDLRLDVQGFAQVMELVPEGTPVTVDGFWQRYQGPVGCGKEPAGQTLWYLRAVQLVQPNPLPQLAELPGQPALPAETAPAPEGTLVPTPSATPTPGATPTATPTLAETPTPDLTASPTATLLATSTATQGAETPTPSATPNPQETPSPTPTPTAEGGEGGTPEATATSSDYPGPSATDTPNPYG